MIFYVLTNNLSKLDNNDISGGIVPVISFSFNILQINIHKLNFSIYITNNSFKLFNADISGEIFPVILLLLKYLHK